jgi:hypothetical protein
MGKQVRTATVVPSRRTFLQKGIPCGIGLGLAAKELGAASDTPAGELAAVATVALSPSSPVIEQYVSVSAALSTCHCHIDRYVWDWGDGTRQNSGRFNCHYYSKPGTYQIKLTAFEGSASDSTLASIAVPAAPTIPPTSVLFARLRKHLSSIRADRDIARNLLDAAGDLIKKAEKHAASTVADQLHVAALFLTAGRMLASIDDLLQPALARGNIPQNVYTSLTVEQMIPMLMSISRSIGRLNPDEMHQHQNSDVAAFSSKPVGMPIIRGTCEDDCQMKYLAATRGTLLMIDAALATCPLLALVPFVGPVLADLCTLQVAETADERLSALQDFLDACTRDCHTVLV